MNKSLEARLNKLERDKGQKGADVVVIAADHEEANERIEALGLHPRITTVIMTDVTKHPSFAAKGAT